MFSFAETRFYYPYVVFFQICGCCLISKYQNKLTYFERLDLQSAVMLTGSFSSKMFHRGPQHCRSVLAASVASNLRWRKQSRRACTEALANLQIFPLKWNLKKLRHHFISFTSTWWRVMMVFRNQKSVYEHLHSQVT